MQSVTVRSISYEEQQTSEDNRITDAAPGKPAALCIQEQPSQA